MYVIYKIINNLCCLLWSRNRNVPILRFKDIQKDIQDEGYVLNFDFTHSTTHLGDRLFFFPLIKALHDKKIPFCITDNGLAERLFYSLYGVSLTFSEGKKYINVAPKSSFLSFFFKYNALVVCDFTDTKVVKSISAELISSFNSLFKLDLVFNDSRSRELPFNLKNNFLNDDEQYIIFNNYVNSGFFRIYFLNKDRLNRKCIEMKNAGYRVIHVGSLLDKKKDKKTYDFVDVDLRGSLSVDEIVSLVRLKNVFGIVTFDNFIMHIGHMLNKTTWVLFRGRFTKRHHLHHIKCVNNTFLDEGQVNYL